MSLAGFVRGGVAAVAGVAMARTGGPLTKGYLVMIRSGLLSGASVRAEIDALEAIREELGRRGWPTRLVRYCVVGEVDVRLQVGALRALAVELLGPCGEFPCGDRWQAVRIEPDSRVAWCGPARSCGTGEVLGFVEDLLRDRVEDLARRYDRLG